MSVFLMRLYNTKPENQEVNLVFENYINKNEYSRNSKQSFLRFGLKYTNKLHFNQSAFNPENTATLLICS